MSSIIIKEIDDFNSKELEQTIRIYSGSFPPVETKPVDRVIQMLKNDDNYHLYVALENNFVVGFSLLYTFEFLGIGLLDYMAVVPQFQNQGLGTMIFRHTLAELQSQIKNLTGLLLEIQKEDAIDSIESIKRKNRIRFYAKLGVKVLADVHYLIPPQHGDEPEETYLMMVPLKKIESLSHDSVIRYIDAIYKQVYQYTNNDLLAKINQFLPNVIRISNMAITD